MSGPKDSKAEIEARRRAELERKRREEAERRARIRKLQNTLRAGLNDIEELRRSFENSRSQIAADANKLGVRVPGILSELDFVAEKNSIVRSVDLGSNSLQDLESSIKKVERSAADLAARSADLIQQACNILRLKKKITEETESYRKVADAAASAMQELSDYSKKVEVEVPDSVAESAQTVNRDNDVKVDLDSDDPDYLSSVIGSLKKGQQAQEKQIADIAGARTAMTEQYCGRLMEEIALAGETVARELEKSRIAEENRRKQEARRQEMQKLEEARQEQQKKEKIISDIYSSVDELRSLHLDVHLRDQMLEILENTALAGYDSAFLKNYQSITVIPFIKKCRVKFIPGRRLNMRFCVRILHWRPGSCRVKRKVLPSTVQRLKDFINLHSIATRSVIFKGLSTRLWRKWDTMFSAAARCCMKEHSMMLCFATGSTLP